MKNPKISIITVCYNSEAHLEECIRSIVSQEYENKEYIVIDGGSKDGTLDIIRKYRDKIAYYISEPDKGISDAFNKGIKAATGDISQAAKLMSLADGCLDVYSGNDDQIVPIMSLGGSGVISVLSNIAPQKTHDIVENYLNGKVDESRRLQLEAIELIDALFCEVNPIPVKHAMNLMGMEVGPLRMPLSPMEDKNLEILKNAMKNYGLIE